MPSRKPNLLWRTRKPIHQDLRDTTQLQTVMPGTDGKLMWVTVAHGSATCIDRLALHLSETRYELFPLIGPPSREVGDTTTMRRVTERKPPKRIERNRQPLDGSARV